MFTYRLVTLGPDGTFDAEPADFDCAGDEEALRLAEERDPAKERELWCGARLVKHYPANRKAY